MRVLLDGHRTCGPDRVAGPRVVLDVSTPPNATAAPTAAATGMNFDAQPAVSASAAPGVAALRRGIGASLFVSAHFCRVSP